MTTVYDFGDASIRRSSKDDLSILTISGVYCRSLAKEIEKLALQVRGNLALEFKDIAVNLALGKKFDSSVLGLLKTLKERYQLRGKLFMLCTPPPELVDVLKLTGAIDGYTILGESSSSLISAGIPSTTKLKAASAPLPSPDQELVHKRIINLNQSLKRTVSLEKGLDSAQKCVMRFLPQVSPEVEGYSFAFSYKSSEKVGGDFFDFIELNDDCLGIVIGDVSGHGLDAALLMGISKKVLSIRAKEVGKGSPKEVLCRVNADLVSDFNKYSFVTVLYGILDVPAHTFTFCRAGHEAPIVFGPKLGSAALETRGVPLGTELGKRATMLFEDKTLAVPLGAYILLCTDGLSESKNQRGMIYSRERLLFTASQAKPSPTPAEVLDGILQSAEEFRDGHPQDDDITAILIHRLEAER